MIATSLIPQHTILPEKCAFVIWTVWTKMRSLAGSAALPRAEKRTETRGMFSNTASLLLLKQITI